MEGEQRKIYSSIKIILKREILEVIIQYYSSSTQCGSSLPRKRKVGPTYLPVLEISNNYENIKTINIQKSK